MDEYRNELEYTNFPTGFVDIEDSCDCYLTLSIADDAEIDLLNEDFTQAVITVLDECYLMRIQFNDLTSNQDYYVLIGLADGCYQSFPHIKRVNLEKRLIQDSAGKTIAFDLLLTDSPDELIFGVISTLGELNLAANAGVSDIKF